MREHVSIAAASTAAVWWRRDWWERKGRTGGELERRESIEACSSQSERLSAKVRCEENVSKELEGPRGGRNGMQYFSFLWNSSERE